MTILREFREFIARGSVVDMAVGIAVGTAFAAIARSLVDDLIMPIVGLVLKDAEFKDLFLVLSPGAVAPPPYPTLEAAQAAGAVTVNYGRFVNTIVTFLIIAAAVFLLVRTINRLHRRRAALEPEPAPEPAVRERPCPFCLRSVPLAATRCAHCTSELPLSS